MNRTRTSRTLAQFLLGIGLVVNVYSQSFHTNGLVAYFPFNGDANDASGNGNNASWITATLTTNRFGKANGAYLFGPKNTAIEVPLNTSVFSNNFTVSIWFKVHDITNTLPTLLHVEAAPGSLFNLAINGLATGPIPLGGVGHLIARAAELGSKYWSLDSNQQTLLGTYCQAVVTKDGTNLTMYLNSQVADVGNVTQPILRRESTLVIGQPPINTTWGAYSFHGILDDIRIYNRALSSNEVGQLYALESAPILNIRKAVYLDSSNLWVGTNYQVQISTDLNAWTNYGAPFTATNSTWRSTNYWELNNWDSVFFRLQTTP